jgi:isocitrate dehydrogenase
LKLNIPSDGTKIGHDGEKLVVPSNPIIPYIIGDGIGIDVTPVMKRVLDYAVNKAYGNSREIKWLELYAGS